jgi:hypothetical protein
VAIKEEFNENQVPKDFTFGAGWSTTGCVTRTAGMENWLAVSGTDHVEQILDDIENSRMRNIDFVEVSAHKLACIGGPYNVENPYVARTNFIKQREKYETLVDLDVEDVDRKFDEGFYHFQDPILPRPTVFFDTDLETSIKRMRERDRVYQNLRQIDCGCCGSPTCLAFAEDFVRGEVKLTDCIFFSDNGGGRLKDEPSEPDREDVP